MCPERVCEDCLIKLRSKFNNLFGERHHLLSCCQQPLIPNTSIPFLSGWISSSPSKAHAVLLKTKTGDLHGPRALGWSSHGCGQARAAAPAWGMPAEPPVHSLGVEPSSKGDCKQPAEQSLLLPPASQYTEQCALRHPCAFCHGFCCHQLWLLNFQASKLCSARFSSAPSTVCLPKHAPSLTRWEGHSRWLKHTSCDLADYVCFSDAEPSSPSLGLWSPLAAGTWGWGLPVPTFSPLVVYWSRRPTQID